MRDDGLSTATFVDGAMRGAQFVEQMQDSNQRQGLREAEMARASRRMSMAEEQHGMAKEQHQTQQELQGLRINQINKQALQEMNQTLADQLVNAEKLTDEQKQLIALHPNLNASRIMSEDYGKALATVDKLMNKEISLSSPEVAQAFDILNPEIGIGSKGGRKVRTKRIYPGKTPGTVVVGLSVDGDEQERPLTERRSADDDDPVKEVPVDMLLQRAIVAKQYREMLTNPEGRDWFVKTYASKQATPTAGQLEEHEELGWIQRQPDGSFKQYDKPGSRGGAGQDPASIKAADAYNQRLIAEGKEPLPFESAFRIANTANKDPLEFVSKHVNTVMKEQKENFIEPGTEGYKTAEQARQDAIQMVQEIRAALSGKTDSASPEASATNRASEPAAEMPPATDHAGRTVRDTVSGKRYKSDGTNWVEIQ